MLITMEAIIMSQAQNCGITNQGPWNTFWSWSEGVGNQITRQYRSLEAFLKQLIFLNSQIFFSFQKMETITNSFELN